jgi:hypothetical protein
MNRFALTSSTADEAAVEQADAAARKSLARLDRTTFRFMQAVTEWRLAALRHLAAHGVPPPEWLKELAEMP